MSGGTIAGRGAAPVRADSAPSASAAAGLVSAGDDDARTVAAGGAWHAESVEVPARLMASRPVAYPPAARNAGVETDVVLELVVAADGAVSDARVLGPHDHGYGLEAAATEAVRWYRFSPARRAGRPVPVRMRWTVQVRLH